jgi:hypothetical protein
VLIRRPIVVLSGTPQCVSPPCDKGGKSIARRILKPSGAPWAEIDGSVWLRTELGQRTPLVLEQAMRQSNGYQISLLFVEAEHFEDREEDAEISESWNVGFKR